MADQKSTEYVFRFLIQFGHWRQIDLETENAGPSVFTRAVGSKVEQVALEWRDYEHDHARRTLVVKGGPYSSPTIARQSASQWRAIMQAALARVWTGADFGDRHYKFNPGQLTEAWNERVSGGTIMSSADGIMVYSADNKPVFSPLSVRAGTHQNNFISTLMAVINLGHQGLDEHSQEAFDLYGASFLLDHAEARFLLLMATAEYLTDEELRGEVVQQHIDSLIEATSNSTLSDGEKDSLTGGLRTLKNQSSRNLLKRRVALLSPRTYNGKTPAKFFDECYALRSRIIHGSGTTRPRHHDIFCQAVILGILVGDLLAIDLLDTVPDVGSRG